MSTTGPRVIESLRRGLQLLAMLERESGTSLHELHRQSAIPKASALRILHTLRLAGRIDRSPDGRYFALRAGASGTRDAPPREPAWALERTQHALEALGRALPWPSDLALPDGLQMRVVASNRQAFGRRWQRVVVGAKVDLLDSALGRCYLAHRPAAEQTSLLQQIFATQPRRSRRRDALLQELQNTAERGYGVRDAHYSGPDSHDQEQLSAIAVPVFSGGLAVAAISCVWNTAQAQHQEVLARCLARLTRAAAELSG